MEVDEATIVTASTKRGASEDPQDVAKRLRTDDADAMDEAAARTRAEMTPAEREEAERACIERPSEPKRSPQRKLRPRSAASLCLRPK